MGVVGDLRWPWAERKNRWPLLLPVTGDISRSIQTAYLLTFCFSATLPSAVFFISISVLYSIYNRPGGPLMQTVSHGVTRRDYKQKEIDRRSPAGSQFAQA